VADWELFGRSLNETCPGQGECCPAERVVEEFSSGGEKTVVVVIIRLLFSPCFDSEESRGDLWRRGSSGILTGIVKIRLSMGVMLLCRQKRGIITCYPFPPSQSLLFAYYTQA